MHWEPKRLPSTTSPHLAAARRGIKHSRLACVNGGASGHKHCYWPRRQDLRKKGETGRADRAWRKAAACCSWGKVGGSARANNVVARLASHVSAQTRLTVTLAVATAVLAPSLIEKVTRHVTPWADAPVLMPVLRAVAVAMVTLVAVELKLLVAGFEQLRTDQLRVHLVVPFGQLLAALDTSNASPARTTRLGGVRPAGASKARGRAFGPTIWWVCRAVVVDPHASKTCVCALARREQSRYACVCECTQRVM